LHIGLELREERTDIGGVNDLCQQAQKRSPFELDPEIIAL
jgi:hypothetical protein